MMIYRSNRIFIFLVVVLFIFNTWMAKLAFIDRGSGDDEHRSLHLQRDTLVETVRLLQQQCNHMRKGDGGEEKQIVCPSKLDVDREKALILGERRTTKGFLTIGISTIRRQSATYIEQTLSSLVEHTSETDKSKTTVVILLADMTETERAIVRNRLSSKFSEHFKSGFFQAIHAPLLFYPPMDGLPQNFGDNDERVRWRAKQVVDYAFLFTYSYGLSKYYMQLEDDVLAMPNFIFAITEFISLYEDKEWTSLEFSPLGYGKLYRSTDLRRLAQFALMFYDQQPIDYLFRYFNNLQAQKEVFLRSPSIFQHIGAQSSLRGKEQHIRDLFFEEDNVKYPNCDNPPATFLTNMDQFSMYMPKLPYTSDPGYFWAKSPSFNQWFMINFEEPHFLKRVVVETGSNTHPQDAIQDGDLEVGGLTLPGREPTECKNFQTIASFNMGMADVDVEESATISRYQVKCVVIRVTEDQTQWLLVREIAIWIKS